MLAAFHPQKERTQADYNSTCGAFELTTDAPCTMTLCWRHVDEPWSLITLMDDAGPSSCA